MIRRVGLAIAALLAAGACRRAPPPPPPLLAIEPSGCAAILAGPVCEVEGARTVRLRVRTAPGAAITVRVEGGAAVVVPPGDDVLVTVELPESARALAVTAEKGGARAEARLPIARRAPPPELTEARALRAKGDAATAAEKLGALIVGADPMTRQQATRALARVERDLGRAEAARARFLTAIRLDAERGRVSDEVDDRLALGYALLYDGRRFAEARVALAPAEALAATYPDGGARVPYFLGLVAYESGDLREALGRFRGAAAASARLGLVDERIDALGALADTLAILGRPQEAADRLREAAEALPADAPPCRRADLLNNTGWTALRAPLGAAADPAEALRAAVALYRGPCPMKAALANALGNLALAELDAGRPALARAALDEARAAAPNADPRLRVVWQTLAARMELVEGRAEAAARLYEEVAALGAAALLPEARLDGALGRARALEALGKADAARAAYDEADAQLDAWARLVPLGEGKDTFVARWERASRERIDFLARAGSPAVAAAAARRSRARILGALGWMDRPGALPPDRRGAWEEALAVYRKARAELDARAATDAFLPGDRQAEATARRRADQEALTAALERALAELGPPKGASTEVPEPAEGELILVYHPVREGWACFAVSREGTVIHRLGAIDPRASKAALAEQLLGATAMRAEIARARRLRVAAYGELGRVDLHALPWEGRPLVDRLPVVYGLDLPAEDRGAGGGAAAGGAPIAVVVSDPLDDLPSARREGAEVAAALAGAGWGVRRLEGRQATSAALSAVLAEPGVTLLHYAGHAEVFGRDGWESALSLAAGGRLTVGDILALPKVPPRVVLSGCDTARTADTARAEGLGLAQAFAVAGSRAVVASARPVDDREARALMAALYRAMVGGGGEPDLAGALRDAQRALTAGGDGWESFRAVAR